MNNIIHRHEAFGPNISNRKVIGVEKSPLMKQDAPAETPAEQPKVEAPAVETKAETPKADVRSEKRAEFAALEKSRKLAAEAKDKLKKAEEMSAAYESKDIDRIAKAHGMATADYVRWVNQKAIGAPTDKPLTPAEQVAQNAKAWQDKMEQDVKWLKEEKASNDKYSYINKNLMPHLVKDPDKYEFITDAGLDDQCELVYTFMNEHYLSTGGKNGGEELDPIPLLDALENDLMKEWQETQEKASKFKKLQKKDEVKSEETKPAEGATVGGDRPAKTVAAAKPVSANKASEAEIFAGINGGGLDENALAESAPSNLVAGPSHSATPAKTNKRQSWQTGGTTPKNSPLSREARLAAMAASQGK